MTHHKFDQNHQNVIETIDLNFHKMFPYLVFIFVAFLSLPVLIWTKYAEENIQHKTEYLVSGILESMCTAIANIRAIIDDKSVFKTVEKEQLLYEGQNDVNENNMRFGKSLRRRKSIIVKVPELDFIEPEEIFQLFETSVKKNKENNLADYKAMIDFMKSQKQQKNIVNALIFYRIANILVLAIVIFAVDYLTLDPKTSIHNFNCRVPYHDGEEFVTCSLRGVKTRILMSEIWKYLNLGIILAGIFGTYSDYRGIKEAARLVMITNPILNHKIQLKEMYQINNLSILLMLSVLSVFNLCRF